MISTHALQRREYNCNLLDISFDCQLFYSSGTIFTEGCNLKNEQCPFDVKMYIVVEYELICGTFWENRRENTVLIIEANNEIGEN